MQIQNIASIFFTFYYVFNTLSIKKYIYIYIYRFILRKKLRMYDSFKNFVDLKFFDEN